MGGDDLSSAAEGGRGGKELKIAEGSMFQVAHDLCQLYLATVKSLNMNVMFKFLKIKKPSSMYHCTL